MTKRQVDTGGNLNRRTVLKGAAAAGAISVVGLPAATGSVAASSHTNMVDVPLTWERSAETADGVIYSTTLSGGVSAALALDTDAAGEVVGTSDGSVWNREEYYEGDPANIAEPNHDFATWDAHNFECPYDEFETRRFTTSFELPSVFQPGDITDVILYAPAYVDDPKFADKYVIPINDNLYINVNGTLVDKRGTSAVVHNDTSYAPIKSTGNLNLESGQWYTVGSLGSDAVDELQPGANSIDVITEEFCNWGGMSRLGLKLVYDCTRCIDEELLVKYEWDDEAGEFVIEDKDEDGDTADDADPNISLESVELEEGEPIKACFTTDYCDVDAVVKAGEETETYTDKEGSFCVEGITTTNPNGKSITHAISNIRFYCEAPDNPTLGQSEEEEE